MSAKHDQNVKGGVDLKAWHNVKYKAQKFDLNHKTYFCQNCEQCYAQHMHIYTFTLIATEIVPPWHPPPYPNRKLPNNLWTHFHW